MRIWAAALALVVIGAVSGAVFVHSGWYNVAASEPHTALMNKLLRTIVAFLTELPQLKAQEYQQLADSGEHHADRHRH